MAASSKRARVDETERTDVPLNPSLPVVLVAPEQLHAHRSLLRGRATLANAADSIHFSKNRSLVFQFVDIYDLVTDDIGKFVSCTLKCGICRKGGGWRWVKGGKAKGSTSNIIAHLQSKHSAIWQNAEHADWIAAGKPLKDQKPKMPSDNLDSNEAGFYIDEFYRRLTRWIVADNRPFTQVENEEFRDLLTYLKPALDGHLVKSKAIWDRVFKDASTARESTQKYLTSLLGLMAISCNGWTSSNRIAFLAIVGSWITEDWRLEEVLLDFVELHGAHTGENMSIVVASALTELGIKDKLLALVGDNASTNGTLVHHLSASLGQSSSKLRWDPEKGQIRCLVHIIHLAVMTPLRSIKAVPMSTDMHDFDPKDLQLTPEEAESFVAINNTEALEDDLNTKLDSSVDLTSAIDKIRKISKLVRSSPQRMELFTATATQIEEWHEQKSRDENRSYKRKAVKNLILDVATRWNSVFLMIERALEFSEAIDALVNHPKITLYRPYGLSRSKWTAVAQVGKWLKFFCSASTMMSAEKYPTLSYSLRVYFLLISYVMDLETGSAVVNSPSLAAGITACKEKLLEFFDKATYDSEYYYFATVLDPRFKDTLFKANKGLMATLFSKEWVKDCAAAFRETCEMFYNNHSPVIDDPNKPSDLVQPVDIEELDEFTRAWKAQIPSASRSRRLSPPNSAAGEIAAYLSEEVTKQPPLVWWSQNAHRFPRLAAMARDFLSIPGTSVAVVRVLNVGRDVISLHHQSLGAETVQMLMNYRAGMLLEKQTRCSNDP
ncbi:AC9 transposase [Ceratobasidium sp. AG-Ba]|nr:AC9 transposase [Ceratobasidium sp. AG-Ba]